MKNPHCYEIYITIGFHITLSTRLNNTKKGLFYKVSYDA